MAKSFTEIATVEVTKLLSPLQNLNTAGQIINFIEELGWDLGDILATGYPITIDVTQFTEDLTTVITDVISLADASDEEAAQIGFDIAKKIPNLITQAIEIAYEIEDIINELQTNAPDIEVTGIELAAAAELMARRLLDLLLYQYLQRYHQRIFSILHILGLAEIVSDEAGMPIKTMQWEPIPKLFTDPGRLINDVYQWDTSVDGDKLLCRMEVVLRAFLIPGGIYRQSATIRNKLQRPEGDDKEIRIPLYQDGVWPDSYLEMDLNLSTIPANNGNKAGLFLYPYLMADVDLEQDLSDNWVFSFRGNFTTNPEIGLELRPPAKLNFVNNIFGDSGSLGELPDAHTEIEIEKKAPKEDLTLIFGSKSGSRFGYKDIGFNIFIGQESGEFTFAVEALINDLTLVIDSGEGDGFIQEILSGIKLESISDLAIGISNKEGFYFKGSSALAITIPIHEQLGPVFLESVKIGVGFGDDVKIILASTFSVELGPITGTVKEIGLEIPMSFPEDNGGNLGPLNIDGVKFLPPSGAGLAVNAGGLTGGGYLEHGNGSYVGILSLTFGEFSLTAIGLINTREGDYSLLVIITVEFNPEIQLSFGFSLKGVGGLIGINRSINSDFLREGLRAKTLGSILFPENPIQNASKVISDIGNGFPVYEGRFVVGPMVKIGWGGGMITADICVLIDLPSPLRIVVLGQLNAILPKPQNASGEAVKRKVVELNLDVLGEWDSGKGTLSIDATLYDSKILVYSLYGDAALRLKTGSNAYFGMSIGGFHPSFSPPPAFPPLRRLTVALADKSYLKISCKIYMAITPNTLQFGANLQLYSRFSGITAEGHLAFDALFYFSPFSFIARMDAGVAVKYRGRRLASVDLDLKLSGPTPWNAAGEASFKIAFWEVGFDFDKTWGDSRKRLLDEVNPLTPLRNDLEENSSWGVTLMGIRNSESFNINQSDEDTETTRDILFMHPAGMLEVREKVLPLNNKLDLFGGAKVKEYNKFSITEFNISFAGESVLSETMPANYINEEFATAQYFEKTASQKLSQPSFESMPGGVIPAETGLKQPGTFCYQPVKFENMLIDEDRISRRSTKFLLHPWQRAFNDLRLARAERSAVSGKSINQGLEPYVSVSEESYYLVDSDTLEPISAVGNTGLSFTSAGQLFDELFADNPGEKRNVEIVPRHDIEMRI